MGGGTAGLKGDTVKNEARINFVVDHDFKHRVRKAATRNGQGVSEYLRIKITESMMRSGDWALRGPTKGDK